MSKLGIMGALLLHTAVATCAWGQLNPVTDRDLYRRTEQANIDLSKATHITDRALSGLRSYQMGNEIGYMRIQTKVASLDLSDTPVEDSWLGHLAGPDGLTHLTTLNLARTRITDKAVKTLATLTSLKKLDLGKCYVTPLGSFGCLITPDGVTQLRKALPGCEILYSRQEVKLTESQTQAIRLLSPVAHLQIDGNGEIVSVDLRRDSKLTHDQLLELGKLSHLGSFQCDAAPATVALLEQLQKLPRLRQLVVANGSLSHDQIQALAKLAHLVVLDLYNTNLTDKELATLVSLSQLVALNVRGTNVRAAGLRQFRDKLPAVKIAYDTRAILSEPPGQKTELNDKFRPMRVQLNDRFEVIVYDMSRFAGADLIGSLLNAMPHLQQLGLRHTKVTDAGLAGLAAMKELRSVDLGNTMINGSGLKNLSAATSLEKLDLWHTEVTDHNLVHLKGLKKLNWLSLAETGIGDGALPHLEKLTSLTYLDLRNTRISSEGAKQIRRALPRCKIETFPK